ncbi:MAG: ABC transporter permease subunit [Deltaproteobacteria bacterium]|nr:ABC transporter permease subunit [Deltaproteobacteria bacterium]
MQTRDSSAGRERPSAPRGIALIVRRELSTYFGTYTGYVVGALVLLVGGLLFNTRAVGSSARYSSDVLSDFFNDASGWTMIAAVVIAMRLIAEERRAGTLALLMNSSLSEGQIVLAKYLSALAFLGALTLATFYMPMLIFLRGKITFGHVFAGYLGLMLLGSAVISMGTFASTLTRSQVVSAVVGGTITAFFVLLWLVARLVDGTLGDVVNYLALHNIHFRPFMNGVISSRDVTYYLSVTIVFLALARASLEARRWST